MSQSLVFTLLMLALVLPVLGAVVLRVLTPRLAPIQLYGAAALIFGVAFVSVLALARSNISSLQIGRLSLLLPVAAPADQAVPLPSVPVVPPPTSTVTLEPTEAPVATTAPPTVSALPATGLPTAEPATAVPPTPEPPTPEPATAVPPTPEPPTPEPTAAPPAPPARRTYTVQAGDTLRGIADQFNVSVQSIIDANNLTAAEADSLHVGQELVIP